MSGRRSPRVDSRGSSARSTLRKEELAAVRDLAMRQAGLEIDANDQARVERVLRERMRDLGENDLGRYVRELADPSQTDEAWRVVEGLLNHETYFFRELGQLGVFRDYVMPELAETRPDRKLYLWSAGCSTGEEAYTIAMMVLDSGLFDGWSVRVLGTDVSRRVLAEARQAVYGPSSFRAMPDGWRERFFVRQRDRYEVVARARGLCQFAQLNLLDESRLSLVGQADVIFCRNVLIHLDDSARARVLATFHDRLRPGGWLLLGHSEGMLPSGTPLRACRLGEELVHRKGSTSEAPAAPDGPSQPAPVRAPMTGAGGR